MSSSSALLTCALSGETPPLDPVVTPSGHICSRRLLLTKLTENGGVDPFDKNSNPRTLDESDLISLHTNGAATGKDANVIPPRLPTSTTLPHLLHQIQSEYDSLLLELYDTRSTLEETRRELSLALYQNDAAVRVVARLAMERDGAREQLGMVSAGLDAARVEAAAAKAEAAVEGRKKRPRDEEDADEDGGQPGPKKPVVVVEPESGADADAADAEDATTEKKIPNADVDAMVSLWKTLSKSRKARAKKDKAAAKNKDDDNKAAAANTIETIQSYVETSKKSFHKSSARAGILSVAYSNGHGGDGGGDGDGDGHDDNGSGKGGGILVTGGRDKHAVVFNVATGRVLSTLVGAKGEVVAVDVMQHHHRSSSSDATTSAGGAKQQKVVVVATGSADGNVRVYTSTSTGGGNNKDDDGSKDGDGGDYELAGTYNVDDGSPITSVAIQPTGQYVLATTQSGKIGFLSMVDSELKLLARFGGGGGGEGGGGVEYTCAGFHPDGLVFCVGTAHGTLQVWDVKSQAMAETLQCHGGGAQSVESLSFSDNGYHFATSTSDGTVQVWDLRKLKNVATLNTPNGGDSVGAVKCVDFDPTGKFLAYGGEDGTVTVVVVKDWDRRVVLPSTTAAAGAAKSPKKSTKKGAASKNKGVTGVVWTAASDGAAAAGAGAASIVTCSDDERPVRFWGVPS